MSANNTREFSEINVVLDNEIMTAEQILQEMVWLKDVKKN